MNLSFLPGNLNLSKDESGFFVIRIGDEQILRTKSRRAALERFKSIRSEMEKQFPTREPNAEEKAQLLSREIGESLIGHNSLGGRKKKSTAGGTRTFGG
jgi:hypothetical protein